jgi:hypothetical protein
MTAPRQTTYHTTRGTIYYRTEDPRAEELATARLPIPPFQPRQRRPHSIQITRFPQGFRFYDPPTPKAPKEYHHFGKDIKKRLFDLVLSRFSTITTTPSLALGSSRSLSPDAQRVPSATQYTAAGTQCSTLHGINPGGEVTMAAALASRGLHSLGAAASRSSVNLTANDARKQSMNSTTRPATSVLLSPGERPVASANGVSCSIIMGEPHVYLMGFDHSNHTHSSENSTAMIRGRMILNITKAAKIKAVTLSFSGKARTEWPEGTIPPSQNDVFGTIKDDVSILFRVISPDRTDDLQVYLLIKQFITKKSGLGIRSSHSLMPVSRTQVTDMVLAVNTRFEMNLRLCQVPICQ